MAEPTETQQNGQRQLSASDQHWVRNTSELLARATLMRRAGLQHEGDRDLFDVLGYKDSIDFNDYLAKYHRQDIAGVIVDKPPRTTWRDGVQVVEKNEEGEAVTPDEGDRDPTDFESEFQQLVESDGLELISRWKRGDQLSRIGRFGIIAVGTRDMNSLEQPLEDDSLSGIDDILYLKPFHEGSIDIEDWVEDETQERFGRPLMYEINEKPDNMGATQDVFVIEDTKVHHSRVIHLTEFKTTSEVFGRPVLQRVYNLLDDLIKVVGGSAEMAWLGAKSGMHFDIDPDFDGTVDEDELTEKAQEWANYLRRWIITQGVDVESLDSQDLDPTGKVDVAVGFISAVTGIPKRVLTGSERGDLASTQDQQNYFGTIGERRTSHVEPHIIRPTLDMLIRAGAMSEPENGYAVKWPSLFELSDQEKAEIMETKAAAISDLSAGSPSVLYTDGELREVTEHPEQRPDQQQQENFKQQEDRDLEEEIAKYKQGD